MLMQHRSYSRPHKQGKYLPLWFGFHTWNSSFTFFSDIHQISLLSEQHARFLSLCIYWNTGSANCSLLWFSSVPPWKLTSQNYWVFGLCPSCGILKIREHNVSEAGYVSALRWGMRHLLCWVCQEESPSNTGQPMSVQLQLYKYLRPGFVEGR
jgi:hypothetical protein